MEHLDEKTIDDLNDKLNLSLEELTVNLETLERLSELEASVVKNGASVASMEALTELSGDVLQDSIPIYTFTVKSSKVNIDYAMEAFNISLNKILDTIIKIISVILGVIFSIITIISAPFKGVLKGIEINDWINNALGRKEAEIILREHETTINGKPTMEELGISTEDSSNMLKVMRSSYTTELDILIANGELGYTIEEGFETILAHVDILKKIENSMTMQLKLVKTIIDDRLQGNDLTAALLDLKELALEENFYLIPFSIKYLYDAITSRGGFLPRNINSLINKLSPNLNVDFKDKDEFWNPVIKEEGRRDLLEKYQYIPMYSATKLFKVDQFFTIDKVPDTEVTKYMRTIKRIEKESKSIDKKGKDVVKALEKISKLDKAFNSRSEDLLDESGYNKNEMIWPLENKGYSAGDILSADLKLDDFYYTAIDFPKNLLIPKPLVISQVLAMKIVSKSMRDAFKIIERNIEMVTDYGNYLKLLQKETKAYNKALEDLENK